MITSINWPTGVIYVPKVDLTLLSGTTYQLDLEAFRLRLKDLEDDEAGMPWPKTHEHVSASTLAGTTFAQQIQILAPYTVTFEDGQYGVNLVGANSNLLDVLNRNQVSVAAQNSAGLITVVQGSGVTPQDKQDIVNGVWDELAAGHVGAGSFGELEAGLAALSAQQLGLIREMHRLWGLDIAFAVEHGELYVKVPADGSLINIQMTQTGSGSSTKVTKQRVP